MGVCKTPEITSTVDNAQKMKFSIKDFFSKCDQVLNGKLHFLCSGSFFLQRQTLTGSLQNNCFKQQLKLEGRPASVLEKDFTTDVLLHKKLSKAK